MGEAETVATLHIHCNFISLGSASQMVTPAMDIYSFGMCALETAALEIQGNGDSGSHVTDDHIARTVESLEEPRQKDFIYRYRRGPARGAEAGGEGKTDLAET